MLCQVVYWVNARQKLAGTAYLGSAYIFLSSGARYIVLQRPDTRTMYEYVYRAPVVIVDVSADTVNLCGTRCWRAVQFCDSRLPLQVPRLHSSDSSWRHGTAIACQKIANTEYIRVPTIVFVRGQIHFTFRGHIFVRCTSMYLEHSSKQTT